MNTRTAVIAFLVSVICGFGFFHWMDSADRATAESPVQMEPEDGRLGVVRQILTWSATDSKIMAENPRARDIKLALVILDGNDRHVVAITQDDCICEGDKVVVCAIKWHHSSPGATGEAAHVAYPNPDRRPFLRQTVSGL